MIACNQNRHNPCQYDRNGPFSGQGAKPPIKVTIDYGDGSQVLQTSLENPYDVHPHGYRRPGRYEVSLTGWSK